MKLEDRARQTAQRTRAAARRMPVERLDAVRIRRRVATLVPALGLAAVVAGGLVLAGLPDREPDPVAATTTTIPAETTTTVPDSTTTTSFIETTTIPPAGIEIGPDVAWLHGIYPNGLGLSTGASYPDLSIAYFGMRTVAWDGVDGVVYLADGGEGKWLLRWARPGEDSLVLELEWFTEALADVVVVDGVQYAILFQPGYVGVEAGFRWIDLNTASEVSPLDGFVRLSGEYALAYGAQGRWAHIEDADWTEVAQGEGGEPIPPFPLPMLVIEDDAGRELLRFEIGDFERPYVTLHDFDGRRLIFSKEPFEPAAAPRTVYFVDLECPGCTQVFEAGPDSFSLVGVEKSTGPVGFPLIP